MAKQTYNVDLGGAYRAVEGVWAEEEAATGEAESWYHIGGTGQTVQVTPHTTEADAKFQAECERQGIDYRRDWT
jgi:hypothetical protein